MSEYTLKDKIEYYLVKLFISFLGILPKKFIYTATKFLATLIFKFEKRRSTLTIKNIALAFPEKSKSEVYNLAQESYENIAIMLAETIMTFHKKLDINDLIINKDETLNILHKYTQNSTSGIIFVTAHFSNWELLAQFMAINGFPMTAIGRKGNNKLIEKNITTPFREKNGTTNVYKENAMLRLAKALKKNEYTGLLIDQKASGKQSTKINFFGHLADTTTSVALLKLKFNPIILPVFVGREENGLYKIHVFQPIEYTAEEENDTDEKIKKMTQKYTDSIENIIRKYPDQWFWMHNRWRLPK